MLNISICKKSCKIKNLMTRALKQVSLMNHESRDTEEKSAEGSSSGPP